MNLDDIHYIVNHLFLPPKLPQEDDRDMGREQALLSHVVDSAQEFIQAMDPAEVDTRIRQCWNILHNMLRSMHDIRQSTHISLEHLQSVVADMRINDILCLHIYKQNAGIILRKRQTEINLEFFQASPAAAAVTGNTGKLIIQFPSRPRLSIPDNSLYITSLCAYLVEMDRMEMADAIPVTKKARSKQKEYRDVADIRYISELLGGIARAITSDINAVASSTVYVTKRINDHVLWKDALLPWRRDAQWLIIRVALQTSLTEWQIDAQSPYGYKAFVTYVLARALEKAYKADLNHDLLYAMNAKVAVRISKLRSSVTAHAGFPFNYITDQIRHCASLLERRWREIKASESLPLDLTPPTRYEIREAEDFSLAKSRAYLSTVYNRSSALQRQSTTFSPEAFEISLIKNLRPRTRGLSPPAEIPKEFTGTDLWLAIEDIEDWIVNGLPSWLTRNAKSECVATLRRLITRHHSIAALFHDPSSSSHNPESFSRVFLIILELWVVLDKMVIELIPLLAEYSPELSVPSFEPLILPQLCQMSRLRAVEKYLTSRHRNAKYPDHSLFRFINHPSSFAARYFNEANDLRMLRTRIQSQASVLKDAKIQECARLNDTYARLRCSSDDLNHEYVDWEDRWGRPRQSHASACEKCALLQQAQALRITTFEWPLPEDEIHSRLVVFELCLPNSFGVWRDITYRLAQHYSSRANPTSPQPTPVLHNYPALQSYFTPNTPAQQITIASTAKSFLVSHYKESELPCEVDAVIKSHPLRYESYDVTTGEWLTSGFPSLTIRRQCMPVLPSGPYEKLAWTIIDTTHTPNMVIARQSECSTEISYHEWEAFGHLRSGNRLQWRNMMLELVKGTITLGDPAVHLLFRQAAWQAEKGSDTDHRESHFDLSETSFGMEATFILRERLNSICENWQEGWTAATLSVLACRLFSLSDSQVVRSNILEFLSSLRETARKWMDQVLHLLKNRKGREGPITETDLRNRVIQLATTCRSTYSLGLDKCSSIFRDARSVSVFIQCGIVLQNHLPGSLCTLPTSLRYMVERDIMLSVQLFSSLMQSIHFESGLEDAAHGIWQGFQRDPFVAWRNVADRWITCKTLIQGDADQTRYIYLNLFDGTFLVDGKTLGNLPKDILQHSLFQTLFQDYSTMDIVPSTMRGMAYQLSHNIQDQVEVHFVLTGHDLVIRTREVQSNATSEFIPTDKLQGDIPNTLLIGMVHLFHDESHNLQFYPAPTGWDPTALPAWTMHFATDPLPLTSHTKLTGVTSDYVGSTVLSPDSRVLKRLSLIFQPLELSITNLLVTWSPSGTSTCSYPLYCGRNLQIALPRYKLTFCIDTGGHLYCKELPGLSLSPVQSTGTLFGLKNKLVLESKDGSGKCKVIIPYGVIKVSQDHANLHPAVTIIPNQDAGLHIRMFIYDVDKLIGRLIGDGTLTSWFWVVYLHILTSYHLYDPLTHRTGGQQALAMLGSANSFAFMELTSEHKHFLQMILKITPIRNYYPSYLRSMEQVEWHPVLSPLSQNELLVPLVEAILDHGNNQALFQSNSSCVTVEYVGATTLRERAELRNSRLVSNEFYRQNQICDHPLLPTCCLDGSDPASIEREGLVNQTAICISHWTTHPNVPVDLWKVFKDWSSFSTQADTNVSFNNSSVWLSKSPCEIWFLLFPLCLSASKSKHHSGLMFALGILSHRSDIDQTLVHALLSVATCTPPIRSLFQQAAYLLPQNQKFNLIPGYSLELHEIEAIAMDSCIPFKSSPQAQLVGYSWETWTDTASRRAQAYHSLCKEQCHTLAMVLFEPWPCSVVQMPNNMTGAYSLIDMSSFEEIVGQLFSSRYLNHCLFQHTNQMNSAFLSIRSQAQLLISLPCPRLPITDTPYPTYMHVTLRHLVQSNTRNAPTVVYSCKVDLPPGEVSSTSGIKVSTVSSTRRLLLQLSGGNSRGFPSRYTSDLLRCVDALEHQLPLNSSPRYHNLPPSAEVFTIIQNTLLPQNLPEEMLSLAGLWPSLGPDNFLHQLSLQQRQGLSQEWQIVLSLLAESLAITQKEKRLAEFQKLGLEAEYVKEVENYGGAGWGALVYPDWALIQLDADLLIRPMQASIAKEMMSPRSQQNTVMQLNMGEGKSSVIVPIISAALADGKQLVRVIVLKPLCVQMFHLLKQRICGLANRRLFYLPFSRNISLDVDKIRKILNIFKACAHSGGVLLCQPEHILSFQLMGLHSLCNTTQTKVTDPLLEAQDWLDRTTRDILDESDEILNVRYQLIYTLGTPGPLQGQPDRWQTTQMVFSLLRDNLLEMSARHPDWLELEHVGSERFPRTRILTSECDHSLLESISKQIVFEERMPSTPFRGYHNSLRNLAFKFLTRIRISEDDCETLKGCSGEYFEQLLLLRGLIAHGILLLSLKEKRWRVDYGLDLRRSMLAVPYRAKDCPAPRAEFGHPDMIIVLTCLSYYYSGLSDNQLDTTFRHLLNTDNPGLRYEDWIKGCLSDLPKSLHNLRGLNLEDADQKYRYIFPGLRYNKAVIDFYLSECVFPKEAKEFQHKLTTNSWDLSREKPRFTTGFSGTNDHSYLLPLSIRQLDSEEQRHTNAQVLGCLLRAENRTVVLTGSNGTALHLLEHVVKQGPQIRVLLDVGAQVLELQNKDVAREWLKRVVEPTIEAAVYCDPANDEFYVLTRDGRAEPLESSLYRTQLDKTLVYLDEARTRGTDFKFPKDTRAVVTLGPKLSKDKLVQGCMRMRKLGNGHSVLFFASSEIWGKIQCCIGDKKARLDSSDVLVWAMRETCAQIKDNGALWASQGLNFDIRRTAWEQYDTDRLSRSDLAKVLREQESRTLEELYGVRPNGNELSEWTSLDRANPSERLKAIREKCREFDISLSRSSALLEEQERELAHEKEDEREVERVLGAEPLEHSIDPALLPFIRNGRTSHILNSLADCLGGTSHASTLLVKSRFFFQSINLRTTGDFARTIQIPPDGAAGSMNDFLRSVQWILRSELDPGMLLLISPFEANALLPDIRKSKFVHLHLYSPRVARQTRTFEGLDFLVVPELNRPAPLVRRIVQELNLFAGQLFFDDLKSYEEVCGLLGLHLSEIPDALKEAMGMSSLDAGGFVRDDFARRALRIRGCVFDASPVAFMRDLIGWRRKGQGFTLTHMGQILHGNALNETEFD